MSRRAVPIHERFWKSVAVSDPDACWLWKQSTRGPGYGSAFMDGRKMDAHRVAWTIACGVIPDGMLVLHTCDTPLCVNPAHLFLGTHKDNTADMIRKGRSKLNTSQGRNPNAKLDIQRVTEIRQLLAEGETHRNIAGRYGVTQASISYINTGKTWK